MPKPSFDITITFSDYNAMPPILIERYGICGVSEKRAKQVYERLKAFLENEFNKE